MAVDTGKELMLFEATVQQAVSNSLSKTEVALADWDAAKKKPEGMERNITVLKLSHQLFSGWLNKSLKGRKDGVSACGRLLEYSKICETLERARSG
jgi:hypothetical protein